MTAALIVLGVLVYAGVAGVCRELMERYTDLGSTDCKVLPWLWPTWLPLAALGAAGSGTRKLTARLLDRPKPPKALPTAKVVQR